MSASSCLSSASPARSCPFDVLGMIFLYLRDEESTYQQYLDDITQVCRSWRIAALTNRRLWSRILISLQGYDDPADFAMCKRRLHRYLERSVAAPLSVEITLDTDYWPPLDEDSMARIQSLIALISQELSRWESLSISFEDEEGLDKWTRRAWEHEPITLLGSFLRSPMPSLRRCRSAGFQQTLKTSCLRSHLSILSRSKVAAPAPPTFLGPLLLLSDTPPTSTAAIPNTFFSFHSVPN